jgi:hypothetical protein
MAGSKDDMKLGKRKHTERCGITSATTMILSDLYYTLGFMYENNMLHLNDYFLAITKDPVLRGIALRVSHMSS